MFRRKDDANLTAEENENAMADTATNENPAATQRDAANAGSNNSSNVPGGAFPTPRAAEPKAPAYRPASPMMDSPQRPKPPMSGSSESSPARSTNRVLTVGNDILLKGEIATCDRLVIEGAVDATLSEVHTVEIAEQGSFKGSAEIEDAEISGLFEGDLTVRNRLVIYSSGKVRGNITYGEIEVERGGEITGKINTIDSARSGRNGAKGGGTTTATKSPSVQAA